MKGWRPPMMTRKPNKPARPDIMPDPNAELRPVYLTREEMKAFKSLREAGKILAFNVKSCPCGASIPTSKTYCSVKCYKEREPNEA